MVEYFSVFLGFTIACAAGCAACIVAMIVYTIEKRSR